MTHLDATHIRVTYAERMAHLDAMHMDVADTTQRVSDAKRITELDATDIGRTVASFRGDNELLLGLVLMSGHLDELHTADLAAVLEAISLSFNRPDVWSGFLPSSQSIVAFNDISGIRRELLKVQERKTIQVQQV